MSERRPGEYDDILRLPYVKSARRPRMRREDRAAQFSAFAALAGYEDAIEETGRVAGRERALSEEDCARLNATLEEIAADPGKDVEYEFVYFVDDASKPGGEYVSHIGRVRSFDPARRAIALRDFTEIRADKIFDIRKISPENAERE